MNYNLIKLLIILIGVLWIGGVQGLYNLFIGILFVSFIVGLILITFFKEDLVFSILRILFSKIIVKYKRLQKHHNQRLIR